MTEIILSGFSSLMLKNCRLFIFGLKDTSIFSEELIFCVLYFMTISVSRLCSHATELLHVSCNVEYLPLFCSVTRRWHGEIWHLHTVRWLVILYEWYEVSSFRTSIPLVPATVTMVIALCHACYSETRIPVDTNLIYFVEWNRIFVTVNNNTFCFATIDKVFHYSILTTCFGPYIRPSSGDVHPHTASTHIRNDYASLDAYIDK
jgi:hypothetical protein